MMSKRGWHEGRRSRRQRFIACFILGIYYYLLFDYYIITLFKYIKFIIIIYVMPLLFIDYTLFIDYLLLIFIIDAIHFHYLFII